MPMYNLIQYSDNYSKTSGTLWQYYRDERNNNLTDSESLKFKIKIIGNAPNDFDKKNVEIIVPLKYLSNFWRTIEMPWINCKVNLILTQSSTCFITYSIDVGRFKIPDAKLDVPVTLTNQDNAKLLQQLKSGFKRTINCHKYQSDPKMREDNI